MILVNWLFWALVAGVLAVVGGGSGTIGYILGYDRAELDEGNRQTGSHRRARRPAAPPRPAAPWELPAAEPAMSGHAGPPAPTSPGSGGPDVARASQITQIEVRALADAAERHIERLIASVQSELTGVVVSARIDSDPATGRRHGYFMAGWFELASGPAYYGIRTESYADLRATIRRDGAPAV